ncbi:MAG TPA: hypothetical protein VGB85_21860, partial [Nannocystis sp.]
TGGEPIDTGTDPGSTTAVLPEPPVIVGFEVEPDLVEDNGLIQLAVATKHADGVRMALDTGEVIELTAGQPASFTGQISAFTGLDNGEHIATLTPWREGVDDGMSVPAPYYIALPDPGQQTAWETGDKIDSSGFVVAIAVLPDRRFVELGTYYLQGEPRCFLRVRGLDNKWGAANMVSILPAYCTATDLTINPDTGALYVLVDRKGDNGVRWWLAEIPSWGKGAKQIAIGSIGDKGLALARHPDMLAVCGAKKVATEDGIDAFAALVRPGQDVEERLFDYTLNMMKHKFAETARDCAFADDTLVMVGEAWGEHSDKEMMQRDRLALLEYDVLTSIGTWTVAGPNLGLQSRGLAVAIDDKKRYHLAGYNCLDDCKPNGDLWGYLPGGMLFTHTPLGPLGSDAFGPHDIAWSPAGYMVIALGELSGQSYVFKVQAFAPEVPVPLWTFTPNDKQGLQIAYAVAVDPFGKVCAGGIGETNYPAFACMGS